MAFILQMRKPRHKQVATTAAKLLQSFLTLCDPIDSSPPGSPVPGILQARTLEWVAFSFSDAWKWKVKVKSLSRVQLLATPWTAAYQAPPSMGFSRQEYWSRVPLPSPKQVKLQIKVSQRQIPVGLGISHVSPLDSCSASTSQLFFCYSLPVFPHQAPASFLESRESLMVITPTSLRTSLHAGPFAWEVPSPPPHLINFSWSSFPDDTVYYDRIC